MGRFIARNIFLFGLFLASTAVSAQQPPYDLFPEVQPPYYRVRYDPSSVLGELMFGVNYTIWIPPETTTLRGVIVHQHGCGEGSCKSGLTGAFDLHWQALAKKHQCALLAPAYEQPDEAECQMWCDPRNGSSAAFQRCLVDLGIASGHPELSTVPWALWGHSGGGHWAGGMVMLHPERIAAVWLRSGVPLFTPNPNRPTIKTHTLPEAALHVPIMCNPGTKEGVTVKGGRFDSVWPANEAFFKTLRAREGFVSVAVDPRTSHECGNQRYLAIPWFDACLTARLPDTAGDTLKPIPQGNHWLAPLYTGVEFTAPVPEKTFSGDKKNAVWFINETVATAWAQYVTDTKVADTTPPPAPTEIRVVGNEITWNAEADFESGISHFVIKRDGMMIARVPDVSKNPFGRPIFQGLQYSDTPVQPLVEMKCVDATAEPGKQHHYDVFSVNTVGLQSN